MNTDDTDREKQDYRGFSRMSADSDEVKRRRREIKNLESR
jgi:hypothetical protein